VPIKDQLTLHTVDGAADLLAGELRRLPEITVLTTQAASVTCHIDGELRDLYSCPLYSTAAIPLDGSPGDKRLDARMPVASVNPGRSAIAA
jgi:tRNA (guanine6-N2)-methyltransferase